MNNCNSGNAASNFGKMANETGICTFCKAKADTKCDRCGDFYCSESCQQKDWPNHRFICFPIPKLVKVGQNLRSDNIAKQDPQPQINPKETKPAKTPKLPPNGSCVSITGFKSSNRCYIRSLIPFIEAQYQNILKEVHEFGKKSSALSDRPKYNSYAVTLRDDKWCRVQILGRAQDNYYRISFKDFGDVSKRYFNDLRKISGHLANLPCLVHMVQLKGINSFSIQSKLVESLTKYTNKEYRIEYVTPDEAGGDVELYQWGSNTLLNSLILTLTSKCKDSDNDIDQVSVASSTSNVNEKKNERHSETKVEEKTNKTVCNAISSSEKTDEFQNKDKHNGSLVSSMSAIKKKVSSCPRQIQMQKPCLIPPFEIIPLNENDQNCKVMIMDDSYNESGYVGCLLDKHFENLKAVSQFLKGSNVGDEPYKPQLNEYCLAIFENDWNRAKVVEKLSDDKFLVVYIDFTNETELTSESIRRYPMSLTLPCYTTLAAIDGLPEEITEEVTTFLRLNCTSFTSWNIDSVRVVDGIRYIKSKELLNKMHEAKIL